MRSVLIFLLVLVAVSAAAGPAACADELDSLLSGFETGEESSGGEEVDELLSGFEEEAGGVEQGRTAGDPLLPLWLKLQGSVSLRAALNFAHDAPPPGMVDYRGLSMFRGYGELIADLSFSGWKARIGGTAFYDGADRLNDQRDLYTDQYLDEYEQETELNEVYLQGSLTDNLDIRLGRQIVVWGKSDNIRVTDILNPLDRRWPGMTDIRYLRLPVTMTKLDYFLGDWNVSAMAVHEPRFDKYPVYNGEFMPVLQPPPLNEPDWSWDNQQLAVALNGIFSGWDISFYAASVFQQNSYLEREPYGPLYRTYDRAFMAGIAANLAVGNWLLKGEAAFWDGLDYSNIDEEKSRLDILGGVEYTGFSDTTISLEIVNRHIIDYDPLLQPLPDGQEQDWTQYAFRFVRNFMHDTLHFTMLLSSYGLFAEEGGFERFQIEYDLNDRFTLTGGVIFYEAGDYPGFSQIGDNDKIFLECKYSF